MALAPVHEDYEDRTEFRSARTPAPKPSVGEAFERTYSAGQRLASHHLELLTLELRSQARRYGSSISLLLLGSALGLLGWVGLAAALVSWDWGGAFPFEVRLALVAAAHLVLAAALVGAGARRLGAASESDAARDDDTGRSDA